MVIGIIRPRPKRPRVSAAQIDVRCKIIESAIHCFNKRDELNRFREVVVGASIER